MVVAFDILAPKIREYLSAHTTFDPTEKRSPVQEFSYWRATHACAATARLLDQSGIPFFQDMKDSFDAFGTSSLLASSQMASEDSTLLQVETQIENLRHVSVNKALDRFANGKTLAAKLRQLRQLITLGEYELVQSALDGINDVSEKDIFSITQQLFRAQGFNREADMNARKIFNADPNHVIQSGEHPRILFSGNGFHFDVNVPKYPQELTPTAAIFYFNYLVLNDELSQALEFAMKCATLGLLSARFVKPLAMVFGKLDLMPAQRIELQNIQNIPIIPLQSGSLELEQWLPAAVRKAACQAPGPSIWFELCSIASSLLAVTTEQDKTSEIYSPLGQKLLQIARPIGQDSVREALIRDGFTTTDKNTSYTQFPIGKGQTKWDCLSPQAIDRTQTPRAKKFLNEATSSNTGTVLFNFHASNMGGRDLLPTIAAARLGVPVMTITIGTFISEDSDPMDQVDELSNLPIVKLGRAATSHHQVTSSALGHLRKGGVLEIAMDVVKSPGVTTMVPWMLRPICVPSYPAALVVALRAKVGITATWVGPDGALIHDIVELDIPPQQGDHATRCLWLLQKLARSCRLFAKESKIPLSVNPIKLRGGAPKVQKKLLLKDWASLPSVASSLMAWLAVTPRDPQHLAIKVPSGETKIGELRDLSLRLASLLLHYQTDKPEHYAADRTFVDQHRIMLILPQGPVFVASTLASLSVGSMLALSQDDLPSEQLIERYREFKPDLLISTASTWARLQAIDPKISAQAGLIVDDSADLTALNDMVLSFEKPSHLPSISASTPGVVIFTSGSTGKPKAVVHPCDALSKNSGEQSIGADALFNLTAQDKLTYIARWDSVCFLDILSSLRAGVTICVPDQATLTSPSQLGQWLTEETISCFAAPSTLFTLLFQSDAMSRDRQPALRVTMPWGERVAKKISDQLYQKFPTSTHFASYGASEALWVAIGTLPRNSNIYSFIGGPGGTLISSVKTTLVDEEGAEVKLGEVGMPCVSGPGVMLGYFDELLALEGSPKPIRVILRDFAKLDADGGIELLGRSDSIIKVAGRRISLLEIEAAAEMVKEIKEAVAVFDKKSDPPHVLLAVTAKNVDENDVVGAVEHSVMKRCFASARPDKVLVLDEFPRLPSGKRDRKAVGKILLENKHAKPISPKEPSPSVIAQYSPLLAKIATWATMRFHLAVNEFDPSDTIPALNSLMVMELLLISEEIYGVFPPEFNFEQSRYLSWVALAEKIEQAAVKVNDS